MSHIALSSPDVGYVGFEHPSEAQDNPPPPFHIQVNQEGDTCIDWTSQYCWTNGWNCLWRGHSVYRNRPLIPHIQVCNEYQHVTGDATYRSCIKVARK